MNVRAKNISPLRVPTISIRPTVKHGHAINRGARPIRPHTTVVRAKNISPVRVPTTSIRPTINNRRTPNRGARPNVTTHRICRGEKYFARPCAIDAPSPPRYDRAPAMRRRTMDVRAKYFSPLRAPTISIRPNHQTSPHHKSWRPPQFAPTPRLYGRKIFRPYVRQRYPFA